MPDMKLYEKKAGQLKALAHPHRLCIVKGLIEKQHNVTEIQGSLGLPQSTVSQHMTRLKAAGIIVGERNGLEVSYRVVDENIIKLVETLLEGKAP